MDSVHNISTPSDLIRQLQPILLQAQHKTDVSAIFEEEQDIPSNSTSLSNVLSGEEDLTNIQILQENSGLSSNIFPVQVNAILEYILTYMQSQNANAINSSDSFESFNMISDLDDQKKCIPKLQELLVLVAKMLKEQSEKNDFGYLSSAQTAGTSNQVLFNNNCNGSLPSSKEGTLNNMGINEKLTSFLVSECVKNNITLQSTQVSENNGSSLLEEAITELVQIAGSVKSNNVADAANFSGLEKVATTDSSADLLTLKLQDLQLAHDFLSEKFSKERLYYNNEITVKESELRNLKKNIMTKDEEIKKLKEENNLLKIDLKDSKPVSPYVDQAENINLLTSPGSITSNSSESINILRAEFKNQLNKIKDYYESELEKLR
ncbi:hypothetical protein QEN19_001746 [Hanseniaspora menglaensis]